MNAHAQGYDPESSNWRARALSMTSSNGRRLDVVRASNVKPKRIDYIWKKRIARGKVTFIGGDPGMGKGMVGIDFAARISTGGLFPDGGEAPLGRVLFLTGEDDPADTIVPRLMAANADLSRLGVVGRILETGNEPRRISLDTDAELVVSEAQRMLSDILIIDPISSYLGAATNSWRDSDMRRVIDPLAEAAARYAIAVLLVGHLTKGGGQHAMYRFQGSIASIAAARFGFLIAPHPQEPELRVMACVKSNLASHPVSLKFRILGKLNVDLDDEIGYVDWAGVSPLTADELLEKAERKGSGQERAEKFLEEYLAAGPVASDDIKEAARKKGVGRDSLWKAKESLGIQAEKQGLDRWLWKLPYEAIADQYASNLPSSAAQYASVQPEASGLGQDASVRFSSKQTPLLPIKPISQTERSVLKNTDPPARPRTRNACPGCGEVDYGPGPSGFPERLCSCGKTWTPLDDI